MKSRQSLLLFCLSILILAGCSPATIQTPEITATDLPSLNFKVYDIPKAVSLSMAGDSNGNLYVIYGQNHNLFFARSADGGHTFSDPVLATGDSNVHVLPVEHPAITAGTNGIV